MKDIRETLVPKPSQVSIFQILLTTRIVPLTNLSMGSINFERKVFPTPFGDWSMTSAPPSYDLVCDVALFWENKGHVGFGFEKLVPRGTVDLIFNLAGKQAMYPDQEKHSSRHFKRAWLSGLFDKPLFVGPAYDAGIMGTHLVGVSVPPWAVYNLFGIDAFEMHNAVFEAEELFGNRVDQVWHQIGEAESIHARYNIIMDFIRSCKNRLARPAPFSALWAASQSQKTSGKMRVQDMCDELSISRKHLNTLFKRAIGLTPKSYGRLSRFRATMDVIHTVSDDSFAGLALDLGFTDQAHLINDFKSFAGESPARFLRNVSSDGESVVYKQ